MPCEVGAQAVAAVQDLPVRVMIYVGDKIFINPFSDRDFVVNYRVEGFHANKVVLEDIAGAIRQRNLDVTKVYAIGAQEDLEKALQTIRQLPQDVYKRQPKRRTGACKRPAFGAQWAAQSLCGAE